MIDLIDHSKLFENLDNKKVKVLVRNNNQPEKLKNLARDRKLQKLLLFRDYDLQDYKWLNKSKIGRKSNSPNQPKKKKSIRKQIEINFQDLHPSPAHLPQQQIQPQQEDGQSLHNPCADSKDPHDTNLDALISQTKSIEEFGSQLDAAANGQRKQASPIKTNHHYDSPARLVVDQSSKFGKSVRINEKNPSHSN